MKWLLLQFLEGRKYLFTIREDSNKMMSISRKSKVFPDLDGIKLRSETEDSIEFFFFHFFI